MPMKKKTRRAKSGEAGASGPKRSKAGFTNPQVHSDKMEAYKYDSKPSTIMSSSVDKEGMADRELKNLMSKRVFQSDKEAISRTNTNKRRYS